MTSIQVHIGHIKEHVQAIEDAIAVGIEKRPATIGLHASACSISLLELYLHKLGKITAGAMLKHEWFKAPMPGQKIAPLAERKLGVEFPHKLEIFSLLYAIEEHRNKLIYGNSTKSIIELIVASFQKLHSLIAEELRNLGEDIEQ